MHGPFLGEFMGTLVLILLGDGVVANVLLKKSKGENSGRIVIATAWGVAVVAGICTAVACGSPGAHINPAVTIGLAAAGDPSRHAHRSTLVSSFAGGYHLARCAPAD